jgi:hypothetical protein
MPTSSKILLVAGLILMLTAVSASAQIIYGQPSSGGARFIYSHWSVEEGGEKTEIDQMAYPINGFIPLKDNLEARLFMAGASNDLEQAGSSYTLSGISDVRVQFGQSLMDDRLLFSLGINAPTGKRALDIDEEWPVMEFLANNYLNFPLRRLGEGFGFNLLAGAAGSSGQTRYGASVMYQFNGTYEAYKDSGDYNPGDLFSIQVSVDRQSDQLLLFAGLGFTTYSTDKLEDEKIFRQSDQFNINAGMSLSGEIISLTTDAGYLIRGRNTRYDTTEAIFDQLKIYGNEFMFNGILNWTFTENWYLSPSLKFRIIGANEYDFDNSSIFGFGTGLGRRLAEDIDLNIGFKYFTGSADGGDIDISGYRLSAGLAAAFK